MKCYAHLLLILCFSHFTLYIMGNSKPVAKKFKTKWNHKIKKKMLCNIKCLESKPRKAHAAAENICSFNEVPDHSASGWAGRGETGTSFPGHSGRLHTAAAAGAGAPEERHTDWHCGLLCSFLRSILSFGVMVLTRHLHGTASLQWIHNPTKG